MVQERTRTAKWRIDRAYNRVYVLSGDHYEFFGTFFALQVTNRSSDRKIIESAANVHGERYE